MTDYLVMTVKANDSDDGTNGKVLYHLQVSVPKGVGWGVSFHQNEECNSLEI